MSRLGAILFRLRGWTPVPLVIAFLAIARPSAATLAAGVPLLVAGELLRVAGLRYLDATARGSRFRAEALATGGPYRLVRHPVYWGNALLLAGLLVAGGAARPAFAGAVAALAALQYAMIARGEEAFLAERFGAAFARYRERVHGLLPIGPPWPEPSAPRRSTSQVLAAEFRTFNALGFLLAAVALKAVVLPGR